MIGFVMFAFTQNFYLLVVGAGFYGCSAGVISAQLGTIARNF